MARPMPLEDRVVELDLREPSYQGLVHPDPDRRLAALLYVEGIAGRGLAWPPNGNFQGTRLARTGGCSRVPVATRVALPRTAGLQSTHQEKCQPAHHHQLLHARLRHPHHGPVT